jgi:signal peptidase I
MTTDDSTVDLDLSKEPVYPLFEAGTSEQFTYRELRANFHIVNSPKLSLLLPPEHGHNVIFEVTSRYEGTEVFRQSSNPDNPDNLSPEGGKQASVQPRVLLELLRGRNDVEISIPLDPTAKVSFPIFYKTPLRDWVESILKALIILVLIQFFVVQTFFIPTSSMHPTLEPGDYIMVEKVSYLFDPPKRGEVVVFQFPDDPRKDFIKRMVATEGDRVQVAKKKLKINGVELVEPYAVHEDNPEELWGRPQYRPYRDYFGPQVVPDRSIFVMGDNRDHSHDSRMWGNLPLYRVKGKAFLGYWPPSHFGLIRHRSAPFQNVDRTLP